MKKCECGSCEKCQLRAAALDTSKEHSRIREVAKGLPPMMSGYGKVWFNKTRNRYHLEAGDGDSEPEVQTALRALRGVTSRSRFSCDAEYVPDGFNEHVCTLGKDENEYNENHLKPVGRTQGAAWELLTHETGGGEYETDADSAEPFTFKKQPEEAKKKEDEEPDGDALAGGNTTNYFMLDSEESKSIFRKSQEQGEVWIKRQITQDAVTTGLHAPLKCMALFVPPGDVKVRTDLIHRTNANPETGISVQIGIIEFFDRDRSGPILIWMALDGQYWCIDGHHRLECAKRARHIVSSAIIRGELVAVESSIPAICFCESDGWSLTMARKLGEAANLGGGLKIEFTDDLVDAGASRILTPKEAKALGAKDSIGTDCGPETLDVIASDSVKIIAGADSSRGILMVVRQHATRADCLNANGRIYPRKVVNAAFKDANTRSLLGITNSEYVHPKYAKDCSNGICTDKFFDNPDRKTAIVNRWLDCDSDGWGDVERTILDTPYGRKVAKAIDDGNPIGLSLRFHFSGSMKKDSNGNTAMVADQMLISTVDDVDNPAVHGAGELIPLTDSSIELMVAYDNLASSPYLGDPFNGENRNTISPPCLEYGDEDDRERLSAQEDQKTMKTDIKRLIADFSSKYSKPGAHQRDFTADGCSIVHAIKAAKDSGDCTKDFMGDFKSALDSSTIAGYRGGTIESQVASELGFDPGTGWGSDIETADGIKKLVHPEASTKAVPHGTGDFKASESGPKSGMDSETNKRITDLLDREEKREKRENIKTAYKAVADAHPELKKLDPVIQDKIKTVVRDGASDPATDFKSAIDAQIDIIMAAKTDAKNAARGLNVHGNTIDLSNPIGKAENKRTGGAYVVNEARPYMAFVDKMLAMADDKCRQARGSSDIIVDPDNSDVKRLRQMNRNILEPILDDFDKKWKSSPNAEAFSAAMDSEEDMVGRWDKDTENFRRQVAASPMHPAIDATTTATIFNQPYIMPVLIIQSFQDLTALQHVGAMGPRGFDKQTGGFMEKGTGFGSELRLPVYSYTNPSGYGYADGIFDAGLLVGEGVGIPPGNTNVYWLDYSIQRRKISSIMTWEAIKNIGNGPANLPLASMELYMMAARESRAIDTALYNEMYNATYEFGAVAVTAEPYTTGNNLLPNNSVYNASSGITVNLNPTKKASDAVVGTTDLSIVYPAAQQAGIAPVIGAIRLLAGGANTNASPYYGYKGTTVIGPGPIVRPRTTAAIQPHGNTSNTTTNPISVTLPANAVQGEFTSSGGIWSYPGTTATFAVDYENGVLLFASGVTGGGSPSVITTSVTIAYSYATNWDDFITDRALASFTTGTYEQYLNGLFTQIDKSAAQSGGYANYVKPDTLIMNLLGSANLTPATIFYMLNSPAGTELWPSPTMIAKRNEVNIHRMNSPWNGRSSTALLTRTGSTKYAVDTPFNIQGPVTVQDSSGNPTGELSFYGQEFSVIATPFPTDINGVTLQCSNRAIIMRMKSQGIGVL